MIRYPAEIKMDIRLEKEYSYYALTVSPPRRDRSPEYLYNGDKPVLIRQLNRCSEHYILYPEFDPNGRLHYHGVVKLTSKMSWGFVKSTIESLIGFCCLKQIKTHGEHIGWLNYCRKDYDSDKMEPIMFKTLAKGRRRLERSKVDPRKIRTITDYFDHAEKGRPARGMPERSERSEESKRSEGSAGTDRGVGDIGEELDFGTENIIYRKMMDFRELDL